MLDTLDTNSLFLWKCIWHYPELNTAEPKNIESSTRVPAVELQPWVLCGASQDYGAATAIPASSFFQLLLCRGHLATFLSFLSFCMSVLFQVCLAPAWLADTGLLPLFLPAQFLPPAYTPCQPVLSVSPLPIYWLFSFILHQSGALGRKGNTSLLC